MGTSDLIHRYFNDYLQQEGIRTGDIDSSTAIFETLGDLGFTGSIDDRASAYAASISVPYTGLMNLISSHFLVAPSALIDFSVDAGTVHLGHAPLNFTTADDVNLSKVALYRAPTGVTLNKSTHFVRRIAATPDTTSDYVDGDDTPVNLLSNGTFASDTIWSKGAGYTISGGAAHKAAGTASNLTQLGLTLASGVVYRGAMTLSAMSASTFAMLLGTTPAAVIAATSTNGLKLGSAASPAANDRVQINATSTTVGSIDDVFLFAQTATCAPQGDWDYYAIPENIIGVEGAQATKLDIIIV